MNEKQIIRELIDVMDSCTVMIDNLEEINRKSNTHMMLPIITSLEQTRERAVDEIKGELFNPANIQFWDLDWDAIREHFEMGE